MDIQPTSLYEVMILSAASAALMSKFLEVVYVSVLSLTVPPLSLERPLSNGHATIIIPGTQWRGGGMGVQQGRGGGRGREEKGGGGGGGVGRRTEEWNEGGGRGVMPQWRT